MNPPAHAHGDGAVLAGAFDGALRAHGVAAGMRRAGTFAEVLAVLPPRTLADLYWRARVTMLPAIGDLAAFDAAFAACFGAAGELAGDAAPAPEPPPTRAVLPPEPSERAAGGEQAQDAPIQWLVASAEERLGTRDFAALDDAERAAILRLMGRVRVGAERRSSRRRRAAARGDRFDLRGTLRRAARTQGELVRRAATRRRETLRPLVFLLDVSGSMAPYARVLLHYARATAIARTKVRAFAFSTRLTDLSALLRRASDERLMAALGAQIADFGGGTRIGAALRDFNDRFGQRGAARGGTVVILSDGWERDDPALVGAQMARLRRLARRIVWVNPNKQHPAYEPLARGMAAALPYLDAFVTGHSYRSLGVLADAIEGRVS